VPLDIDFLRQVDLFKNLEEGELEQIRSIIAVRSFPKHSLLFLENSEGDGLYLIKSGAVKIFRATEEGREKILAIFRRGDFFGEMSLLDGGLRSASAETMEKSVVMVLRRSEFIRLLERFPALSMKIIHALCRRLRRANEQIEMIAFWDVRSRVLKILLDLAYEHGTGLDRGRRIDLRLTHQELASLAAASRETVTRVLQELQDQGLIHMDGRNIVVLPPAESYLGAGYL